MRQIIYSFNQKSNQPIFWRDKNTFIMPKKPLKRFSHISKKKVRRFDTLDGSLLKEIPLLPREKIVGLNEKKENLSVHSNKRKVRKIPIVSQKRSPVHIPCQYPIQEQKRAVSEADLFEWFWILIQLFQLLDFIVLFRNKRIVLGWFPHKKIFFILRKEILNG